LPLALLMYQPHINRKCENADGFGFDASTINFGESCDAEKPILRLIKAVCLKQLDSSISSPT